MRSYVRIVALVSLASVLEGAPVLAADFSENFEETKPPAEMFQGKLLLSADGAWVGKLEEGTYFLINRETPGAVKTIVLPKPSASGAPLEVAVDIFGQFQGQQAGAGLLYGYAPDGTYYAFVVTPSGGYAVYRADASGLRRLSEGTNPVIRPASVNRLTVRLEGPEAILLVNGERVFGHEAGTRAGELTRPVGLIALDVGAYSFDNFTVSSD